MLVVCFVLLNYICVTNELQITIKQMKKAEVSIYIDELRPKKDGKCSVKIRVSFNRKRKYFSTGIDLTVDEFEKVFNAKRRTDEQKEIEEKRIQNDKVKTALNIQNERKMEVVKIGVDFLKNSTDKTHEKEMTNKKLLADGLKTAFTKPKQKGD
jgi:hypothetical protein